MHTHVLYEVKALYAYSVHALEKGLITKTNCAIWTERIYVSSIPSLMQDYIYIFISFLMYCNMFFTLGLIC